MVVETSLVLVDNTLMKVAMFVAVQALIYLILSSSSNLFSKNKLRSFNSFRPARSASINRLLAAISDLPTGAADDPASPSSSPNPAKYR
ncbi:hypothetical protein Pyn_21960 [Prunus yedoensis var. nudiflora]|uniref:Uncharacterized protein n=1 Tax=Prunus yedoensis var. nudiflora TaxID=2094558 RepID=A0A314ZCR6_PRUYE|nr:hypothetical protein Pyn_21960 [Prunus yedoensis var. nudiflora]